jgi:hypothetical protein
MIFPEQFGVMDQRKWISAEKRAPTHHSLDVGPIEIFPEVSLRSTADLGTV